MYKNFKEGKMAINIEGPTTQGPALSSYLNCLQTPPATRHVMDTSHIFTDFQKPIGSWQRWPQGRRWGGLKMHQAWENPPSMFPPTAYIGDSWAAPYTLKGNSHFRHLFHINRICHKYLIGVGPTSLSHMYLKNGSSFTRLYSELPLK